MAATQPVSVAHYPTRFGIKTTAYAVTDRQLMGVIRAMAVRRRHKLKKGQNSTADAGRLIGRQEPMGPAIDTTCVPQTVYGSRSRLGHGPAYAPVQPPGGRPWPSTVPEETHGGRTAGVAQSPASHVRIVTSWRCQDDRRAAPHKQLSLADWPTRGGRVRPGLAVAGPKLADDWPCVSSPNSCTSGLQQQGYRSL